MFLSLDEQRKRELEKFAAASDLERDILSVRLGSFSKADISYLKWLLLSDS